LFFEAVGAVVKIGSGYYKTTKRKFSLQKSVNHSFSDLGCWLIGMAFEGVPYLELVLAIVRFVISFAINFLKVMAFLRRQRSRLDSLDEESNRGESRQQPPQPPECNLQDVIEMILEIVAALF